MARLGFDFTQTQLKCRGWREELPQRPGERGLCCPPTLYTVFLSKLKNTFASSEVQVFFQHTPTTTTFIFLLTTERLPQKSLGRGLVFLPLSVMLGLPHVQPVLYAAEFPS